MLMVALHDPRFSVMIILSRERPNDTSQTLQGSQEAGPLDLEVGWVWVERRGNNRQESGSE